MTDPRGILIEFSGLPGTGKSTLARHLAAQTGAVLLRIDEIEAALRRNGLTPEQTGLAAYSVAHDVAASHLRRGLAVIADAVNPVEEARAGWRGLAQDCGVRHVVIETQCLDEGEHRRLVRARDNDVPGWTYPSWERIRQDAHEYQPRTDPRLVVDTTRPVAACHREIATHLGLGTLRPEQNKEFSLHGSSDLSTDIEPNFVYRISKARKPGGPPRCSNTTDGPSHTTSNTWRSSMSTIIVQPGQGAHPNPDSAARQRQARLASATADQMEAALAFLSMIDPQAFEIAFTAAAPPVGETPDDEEAIPVCRHCHAPVGIFLAHGLEWQHFRGDGTTSGAQEIYDPGHAAEATWLLPDETPEDL